MPDPELSTQRRSDDVAMSSDKVVERLCRDPLGAALWRAAVAEEMVLVLQEQSGMYRDRVEALQRQRSPATSPPADGE